MQITPELKMRVMVYIIAVLIVAVGAGLFYLIWQDNQAAVDQAAIQVGTNNKYSGVTIDSSVTSSPIFKSLEAINAPTPDATSTTPDQDVYCDSNTSTPTCDADNTPCIAMRMTCDKVTCKCVSINVDEEAVKKAERRKSNPFAPFQAPTPVTQSEINKTAP